MNKQFFTAFIAGFLFLSLVIGTIIFTNWNFIIKNPTCVMISAVYFATLGVTMGIIILIAICNHYKILVTAKS